MGQALVRGIPRFPELRLAGAVERSDCPALGKDAGVVAGCSETGILINADLPSAAQAARVMIDFTLADAVLEHVRFAVEQKKAMVIGTTGFGETGKTEIAAAAHLIPIVCAPNMSVGANLLFALVKQAAIVLGLDYDVEIVEVHHKHKKDAPSGTALRLAERVAEGRQQDFRKVALYGREGLTGERPRGQIGIHAVRAGDAVGDHTVFFAREGERVELAHRATSRDAFAMGALRAALWVAGRDPGLYDMQDVLGL
jgi:4-hydroxy-tetrahydrodipicolinate reductase